MSEGACLCWGTLGFVFLVARAGLSLFKKNKNFSFLLIALTNRDTDTGGHRGVMKPLKFMFKKATCQKSKEKGEGLGHGDVTQVSKFFAHKGTKSLA